MESPSRNEDEGAPMRKVLGYANAETAAIILDIDNERGRQDYWLETARLTWSEARKDKPLTRRDVALLSLAEQLEQAYEDYRPSGTDGNDIYSSLLSTALGRVEWREVAEHVLNKMREHDRPQPQR